MRKKFLRKLALAMAVVVGITSISVSNLGSAKAANTTAGTITKTTVGAADYSTGFFKDSSDNWKVEKGQTLVVTFKNDNPYETGSYGNFKNYIAVLSALPYTDANYGSDDEYIVQRADNWGWGTKWDAATLRSWIEWDYHGAVYDEATCQMVVSRDENNEVNIVVYAINTIDIDEVPTEKRFYNAQKFTLTDEDELYAYFSLEVCQLTIQDVTYYDGVVIGAPNMSSGFEFAFSPSYEIKDGETVMFMTENYIGGANWDSVRTIFSNVAFGGADRSDYITTRFDRWIDGGSCITTGHITNVGDTTTNFDFDNVDTNYDGTYDEACNGAPTTITATRDGARVSYRAEVAGLDGKEYYYEFKFDLPAEDAPCYVWLTTTWSYLILDEVLVGSSLSDLTLEKGATSTVNPGTIPTDATVEYSSSNETAAIVGADGKITAVAPGTSTITVKYTYGHTSIEKTFDVEVVISMTGISVDETEVDLYVGPVEDTHTIVTTVAPSDTTDTPVITYKSSDETVATVSEDGEVTAVGPGTATITVTATAGTNVKTATVKVNSWVVPTGIKVENSNIVVNVGDTEEIEYSVLPENVNVDYEFKICTDDTDETIATVDENGVVTGVKAGITTVYVELYVDGSDEASYASTVTITVKQPMTGITASVENDVMYKGDEQAITVDVVPNDTTDTPVITYTSSAEDVATVDEDGNITAVGKGTATITVTATADDNVKTATVEVTVKVNAENITIDNTMSLVAGDSATLTTTVGPEGCEDDYTVEFTSSNEDVATVDADGKVTAVAEGTAIIRAILKVNGQTVDFAECDLTVQAEKIPMTGIEVGSANVTLNKGENSQINVTVNPTYTTDRPEITYSSSSEDVATVDNTGKITAVGKGTATITVTATVGDNVKTATVVVNVKVPMTGATVTTDKDVIYIGGDGATITATVVPEDTTDEYTVTYESSDKNIATVDADGKVTAVAAGNVTITVKAGEFTETVDIEVKEPVVDSDVAAGEGAPEVDVEINEEDLEEILDLTEEEKEAVLEGAEAILKVEVNDASSTVTADEKAKIETALKTIEKVVLGDKLIYMDIDVNKLVGQSSTPLTELKKAIEITVAVPTEWILADNSGRTYKVVRIHDGQAELLDGTFDATTKTFTFSTDKFSTYALTYVDAKVDDGSDNGGNGTTGADKTGDITNAAVVFAVLLSAAGALVVARKRKVTE